MGVLVDGQAKIEQPSLVDHENSLIRGFARSPVMGVEQLGVIIPEIHGEERFPFELLVFLKSAEDEGERFFIDLDELFYFFSGNFSLAESNEKVFCLDFFEIPLDPEPDSGDELQGLRRIACCLPLLKERFPVGAGVHQKNAQGRIFGDGYDRDIGDFRLLLIIGIEKGMGDPRREDNHGSRFSRRSFGNPFGQGDFIFYFLFKWVRKVIAEQDSLPRHIDIPYEVVISSSMIAVPDIFLKEAVCQEDKGGVHFDIVTVVADSQGGIPEISGHNREKGDPLAGASLKECIAFRPRNLCG
jgi:hypothetical protein